MTNTDFASAGVFLSFPSALAERERRALLLGGAAAQTAARGLFSRIGGPLAAPKGLRQPATALPPILSTQRYVGDNNSSSTMISPAPT